MIAAEIIVYTLGIYALIGVGFAVYFVLAGARRLDDAAKGAGVGFRLIIIPAAAALWPLLAFRILNGKKRPEETNAHRRAAQEEAER